MASKFAETLLAKLDQGDGVLVAMEQIEYEDLIDAELSGVRTVLRDALRQPVHSGACAKSGPLGNDAVCTCWIVRARALYERLKPDTSAAEPGKGKG